MVQNLALMEIVETMTCNGVWTVVIQHRSSFICPQNSIGDFQMVGFYLSHLNSLTAGKEVNNCVLLW